eukprot:COSAG02_NODE_2147_length_9663_cov_8.071936_10_plen_207_part_00
MPQVAVLLPVLSALLAAANPLPSEMQQATGLDQNCTVTIAKSSDLVFGGGAGLQANPLLELRSGSPHSKSTASLSKQLVPGVTVSRLSMAYRYETGYGEKSNASCGVRFSIRVGGKIVFSSRVLTTYPYSKSKDPNAYSPPVVVDSDNLGVAVTPNDRKVEFEFANDCRNVQLLLPLVTMACPDRQYSIDLHLIVWTTTVAWRAPS